MDARGHIAALRFGLGPRPDQPPPAQAEPWLLGQLDAPDAPPPPPAGWDRVPSLVDAMQAVQEDRKTPGLPANEQKARILGNAQFQAWAGHLVTTPQPFRERLVMFWANHFTVSRRTVSVLFYGDSYLRDAIRPHVLGRFEDMVLAAERHPAMLAYLNQASSVGPDSPAGQRGRRGLNENLAREILELHTLSPASGYTQADVTEFARLLTGLSIVANREPWGTVFRPESNEPGEKTVMGRRFGAGEESVEAALRFLANHPATHRHLATKLTRHFVADDPPPACVARIEGVLRDTRGDLGAATRALVGMKEAWAPPLGKLRSPVELMVAACRATGAGAEAASLVSSGSAILGQPILTAPAPNGWPDTAAAWASPEGMVQRLDRMHVVASRPRAQEPRETLELALGPLASPETRQAVARAGSPRDALTLLLGSPEFQRR